MSVHQSEATVSVAWDPSFRRLRAGGATVYTVDHGSHISIVGGGRTRTWGAGNINVGSRWGISKVCRYV